MDPVFEHRANHDLRINFNISKGDITFMEFVKNLDRVVHHPAYIDTYNILIDIREANFIDFAKNNSVLVDFIDETISTFNMKRKCAIVTTNPTDVVHATMLIKRFQKMGIRFAFYIFSSEEAALDWLLV
jgi:hypothetical protein